MPLSKSNVYTIDDIYALPDGTRAELIDGQIYDMAPPSPFAVFLNQDERNYVEPDISVICDPNKLNEKGCNGAPDFIIEIVSPSSQRMDYLTKLFKYRTAGVKEYWIVNPLQKTVQVYSFIDVEDSMQYSFDDKIKVETFDDLYICITDLLK